MASESSSSENLPVLANVPEARVIEPAQRQTSLSVAGPVAAATGGALAGIGALVVARVLRNGLRRSSRSSVRIGGRRGGKLDVAATRSFLVDVHVLNPRR